MADPSHKGLLECPICLDIFTSPKMLPCQHTFCLSCLEGHARQAKETLSCPNCRAEHVIPESGVEGFPDNLVVQCLLCINTCDNKFSKCSDCKRKTILQKSESCNQRVCNDCHSTRNLLQEEITSVLKTMNDKMTNRLHNQDEAFVKEVWSKSLENALKEKGKVVQMFDEATTALNVRKDSILRQLETITRFQKMVIDGDVLDHYVKQMQECETYESLRELRDSLSTQDFEQALLSLDTGIRFKYDMSGVSKFGQIVTVSGESLQIHSAASSVTSKTPAAELTDQDEEGMTANIDSDEDCQFTNVYIKHFTEEVDDDKLVEIFEQFGPVSSAKIMRDMDGKSKRFAFVEFKDHDAAKECIDKFHGKEVENLTSYRYTLYVQPAQRKAQRKAELKEHFEEIKTEHTKSYEGVNLYVKNFDGIVDDERLRKEFQPFGTITSAKVMRDDKNHSKGFGFVCFSSSEEATKAMTEMNGRILAEKPLYVALAQRKDIRKAQLASQHQQRLKAMRVPGGGAPPINQMFQPAGANFYMPTLAQQPRGYFSTTMPPV